jgi:hypothetical protein
MKKKQILIFLLLLQSIIGNAQKRWGIYTGMNLSPSPTYNSAYLQNANMQYSNLNELRPYFGLPSNNKSFMHKHIALWRVIKQKQKMAYKAELGVISFGYKENRISSPAFGSYPWGSGFLPPGIVNMQYTHYAHYMYVGPTATVLVKNRLNTELGLFYWFQDTEKKLVALSNVYEVVASVQNDPNEKTIITKRLLNPDSRSGGLMARIGLSYNFEPNLRLHLLYNQFITPANRRTEWGRIYHRGLGIGLSYEFGKKLKTK